MNDLINRLRRHQDVALLEPDCFNPLDIVLDCLEAADILEELDEKQKKKRKKSRRKDRCVICEDGRYFFNHKGDLSTMWINRVGHDGYAIVYERGRIPVNFCPRCGRKLEK